jgi:hypothetical protein
MLAISTSLLLLLQGILCFKSMLFTSINTYKMASPILQVWELRIAEWEGMIVMPPSFPHNAASVRAQLRFSSAEAISLTRGL